MSCVSQSSFPGSSEGSLWILKIACPRGKEWQPETAAHTPLRASKPGLRSPPRSTLLQATSVSVSCESVCACGGPLSEPLVVDRPHRLRPHPVSTSPSLHWAAHSGLSLPDSLPSIGASPLSLAGPSTPHKSQRGHFSRDTFLPFTPHADGTTCSFTAALHSAPHPSSLSFSHIMSEHGRMTDTERDQIDQDAQTFMRTCSEAIQQLRTQGEVF